MKNSKLISDAWELQSLRLFYLVVVISLPFVIFLNKMGIAIDILYVTFFIISILGIRRLNKKWRNSPELQSAFKNSSLHEFMKADGEEVVKNKW